MGCLGIIWKRRREKNPKFTLFCVQLHLRTESIKMIFQSSCFSLEGGNDLPPSFSLPGNNSDCWEDAALPSHFAGTNRWSCRLLGPPTPRQALRPSVLWNNSNVFSFSCVHGWTVQHLSALVRFQGSLLSCLLPVFYPSLSAMLLSSQPELLSS